MDKWILSYKDNSNQQLITLTSGHIKNSLFCANHYNLYLFNTVMRSEKNAGSRRPLYLIFSLHYDQPITKNNLVSWEIEMMKFYRKIRWIQWKTNPTLYHTFIKDIINDRKRSCFLELIIIIFLCFQHYKPYI